ncbi:MAG TPA: TonB-dependent receptor, partial [Gemmatimonas sp.]|nr:TonB-dependent receptor [Gemmatimonas sp.]
TALTDLGAIPNSAIERIEVLRDGAAAQYGSDAIAGVVNVVLKSGVRRDLRVGAGSVLSAEGGRSFRDGRRADVGGSFGVATKGGTRLTVSGELRDRSGTNRAYPDLRAPYFTNDPRNIGFTPRVAAHIGNGELKEGLFFLTADAPLGRGIEAYGFGGVAERRGVSPDAVFRRPSDRSTVRAIHPDGFLPEVINGIGDRSAVAGLRGTVRGWRWDLSAGWGGNRLEYSVGNSNNPSLGATSPTLFDAGSVAGQQWTFNGDVTGSLSIASLPVSLSSGVEIRAERYRIGAGEPDSWRDGAVRILDGPLAGQLASVGAQGLLGYRPVDVLTGRRSNAAVYVEVEGRAFSRLLLQSAMRAERYSDFGSTVTGKFAGRIELVKGVAARGSISTGFRAPALSQQYFSSSRISFRVIDGVNTVRLIRTFPVHTPEAQLMGATPLRAERSLDYSGVMTVEFPRFPVISADWYQIGIDGRIGLTGAVTGASIAPLFEQNGLRGIDGGNYFSNRIDTRTRGLDVVAKHAMLFGRGGALRLLAGYNRNQTAVVRVLPAPSPLRQFDSLLFNRTSRGIIERGQPQGSVILTATHDVGPLSMTLHGQRAGSTAQLDQVNPAADQIMRARWITDMRVAYRVRPSVQITVSAANLFDVYPNEWFDFKNGAAAQGPSLNGVSRYPGGLSPFGMNGRTIHLILAYR